MLACSMAFGVNNSAGSNAPLPTPNPHGSLKAPCENCHTPAAWMPIRKNPEFDHNKTAHPLRGMHVNVPCQECHLDPTSATLASSARIAMPTCTAAKMGRNATSVIA
jgi:hypothetical protein